MSTEQHWAAQDGFDIRLCWGPPGVRALGDSPVMVLVDVLRFTTALDVATAAGALVLPAPWPFDGTAPPGVALADGRAPRRLSLSPESLASLAPGERIMLPSPNGSRCSALARRDGATVVGACLRNAAAVAAWCLDQHAGPIAVIPCGERWPDGSLRPAVEDALGAGAVVAELQALAAGLRPSPEAQAAAAAFRSAVPDLAACVGESASGRQLRSRGREEDIAWATAPNASACVPVLGPDGAFSNRAAAEWHAGAP